MHAASWLHKWLSPGRPAADEEVEADERVDLESIRCEMAAAVKSCSTRHRVRAAEMILRAPGATELWLLRSELYLYLAQDLGQVEATVRINALMPLFRGWVPQVAGAPGSRAAGARLLQ